MVPCVTPCNGVAVSVLPGLVRLKKISRNSVFRKGGMVFFWAMAKQRQGLVDGLYFHAGAQGEGSPSPPELRCSTSCRWWFSIQLLLPCRRLQDSFHPLPPTALGTPQALTTRVRAPELIIIIIII